jgi:hypothetical protein
MSENTLVNETATGAEVEETVNQAEESKTYTQREVDDMMARMKGSITKKVLRPYEELGDPEELRQLKAEAEKRRTEQQLKRGEFEKTLQELASKKDAEIQKRDAMIKEYKVNTPLIDAAARYDSVNPAQVRQLLSSKVRLNETGEEVEVLDDNGNVRYNDQGSLLTVDDFVKEWLDLNPHFRKAGVTTTSTKTSVAPGRLAGDIDLANMDMSNPEHRKLYKEAKQKGLL